MYEWDWSQPAAGSSEGVLPDPGPSRLPRSEVARTALLHWQEHCLECAPPQCYAACSLYVERPDGACARFVYGIRPRPTASGLLGRAADLRFRRWGKLESRLYLGGVAVAAHRRADRLDRLAARSAAALSRLLAPLLPRHAPSRWLAGLRRRVLHRALDGAEADRFDDFVIECVSHHPEPFRLVLEIHDGETLAFRHAVPIEPGSNHHRLPVAGMRLPRGGSEAKISVYPENDTEAHLVFLWLDFVAYAERPAAGGARAAEKVKCVAWDLDNTLWRGTLAESGDEDLPLVPEAVALVRALDERGVLQTIVSKNNHDDAWPHLEAAGLAEYFLSPAINWGQKSQNLRQVAEALDLGVDSFALIDDSEFERHEVASALPQVRVYAESEIPQLLARPEFDVPTTEMSRKRRETYRANAARVRASETFAGDYEAFLRSCGMRMHIFVPREPAAVERCLELIQRSNQLNLSTRRYGREEIEALLADEGVGCFAFDCEDRFGAYGIVGFASVDEKRDPPTLLDFVLSCRVARKRVEHTFFQWLADREAARGCTRLRADLIRTAKNAALFRVFDETPFRTVDEAGEQRHLELDLRERVVPEPVIDVTADVS